MLGLTANVYKTQRHGTTSDCTNGGISSRCDTVTVVGIEGAEIFEANEDRPAVKLVFRTICGRRIVHAEPVDPVPEGHVGWMMGGNYIATSDSRFSKAIGGFYGAIPLHDRSETYEQYDQLSR